MFVPLDEADHDSDDAWAGYANLLNWWWVYSWVDSLTALREMAEDCRALPPVDEVRALGAVCKVDEL